MNRFTCDWIYNILVVLCDGKVVCGCADPLGDRPLGNLNQSSLHEIWNGPTAQKIRHDLNQGFSPFCLECGLKRPLMPQEDIPQRAIRQETIPRIFLEPTVLCNLACFHSVCAKSSGIITSRDRKRFPQDQFEKMMTSIGHELIRLDFFNYGEPFLHPQAVEMLEFVKNQYPHIYLYVSTNGLLLDRQKIQRLVKSGLDEITFSVDGSDPETYIKYRVGGDFSKVLENMQIFVEERNKAGFEIPFINWRYILFNWNDSKANMNSARQLAKKIDVDRFTWEITDHPQEAVSKKYQIGTRPWKKILHEIWDTSQLTNAIDSKRYLARIKPERNAISAAAGQAFKIRIKVKNTGGAFWWHITKSGKRIIRLGAQLYNSDKKILNRDFARAFLPRSIRGGESVEISLGIPAIMDPGNYFLKLDMVSEGIDWFESALSPTPWISLKIR